MEGRDLPLAARAARRRTDPVRPPRLASFSIFAAILGAAGLPIYIHSPKFYADAYGLSLGALGAVLAALRLVDVVQDPALGWLAARTAGMRRASAWLAVVLLAASMIGLFAITPPFDPLAWFAAMSFLLFSAFSFLTIAFYATGVRAADALGPNGHVRLAAWRETGTLLGVSAAAVAPLALATAFDAPFAAFAVLFAALALAAGAAMAGEWRGGAAAAPPAFARVLADPLARRYLVLALVNAAPVAVTSTLFLFFVDDRLALSGWEGPLLLLFFLSAAGAAPIWGRLARQIGAVDALLVAMVASVASFAGALWLEPGALVAFAMICLASGAALGADLTLLPALFAERLERIAPDASGGFGLWSFATKATLALAAVTLLPLLEASGYQSGLNHQPDSALNVLTLLYAGLPLLLKLTAIALLLTVRWSNGVVNADLRD